MARPAAGQISPLQWELAGGLSLPVQQFADAGGVEGAADADAAFSVQFSVGSGWWSPYVGFSQVRAGCGSGGACAEGETLAATSFALGLRLNPVTLGRVTPFVLAGVFTPTVEARVAGPAPGAPGSSSPPADRGTSDRALGLELGGGLLVRAGERWGLRPQARYARATPSFDAGDVRLRWVVVDLALVIGF
ncbi:MAG: hypothetical protein D6701_07170 [Gemmatimonadetes bacterium]|nr:MAG: hypothetical protein D6701_07170 [Gemmatimonadota bacterium]